MIILRFNNIKEESSFPDFENADYYILGKEALELLKGVKGIITNDVDTSSNKVVKAGDLNGKPIFYSSAISENEIIGLNKSIDGGAKIVYSSILGERK